MKFRAKMKVKQVSDEIYAEKVKFVCEYDNTIPEDQRFNAATPVGKCSLDINSAFLKGKIHVGQKYYLDFTLVEEGKEEEHD